MRKWSWIVTVCFLSSMSFGEMVLFRTSTNYVTTGASLQGVLDVAVTTNVQEIAGLSITIRTDDPEHKLSANSRSFGANDTTTTDDEASRFDSGEKVVLSFSKDVEITYFDFRNFESGEAFHFAVSNQPVFTIHHDDQDNTSSDYISTNLFITANTPVELYATTTGNVGFEGIDLSVREEVVPVLPVELMLTWSNGMVCVGTSFSEQPITNYILQSCEHLASNEWSTISLPFSSETNWSFDATNSSKFFRAVGE